MSMTDDSSAAPIPAPDSQLARRLARFLIGIALLAALLGLLAIGFGLIFQEPWRIPVTIGNIVPFVALAVIILAVGGAALAFRRPRLPRLLLPATIAVALAIVTVVIIATNQLVFGAPPCAC